LIKNSTAPDSSAGPIARYVVVTADEDDRNVETGINELSLHLKAVSARKCEIEHQTTGLVRPLAREEGRSGIERLGQQSHHFQETGD